MRKVFLQGLLFELYLGITGHVLKAAAAAQVGKIAGWRGPLWCRGQYFEGSQFIKLATRANHFGNH